MLIFAACRVATLHLDSREVKVPVPCRLISQIGLSFGWSSGKVTQNSVKPTLPQGDGTLEDLAERELRRHRVAAVPVNGMGRTFYVDSIGVVRLRRPRPLAKWHGRVVNIQLWRNPRQRGCIYRGTRCLVRLSLDMPRTRPTIVV